MRVKKNGLRKVLPAVCIIVLSAIAAGLWFCSDGIHIAGPFVHFETSAQCWLYDPVEGTIRGETAVSLSGYGCAWDIPFDNFHGGGTFYGSILPDAFPMQGPQMIGLSSANGVLRFSFFGITSHEDAETGGIISGIDDLVYRLLMDRSGRFLMNVSEEASRLTIIYADSQADVCGVYEQLSKSFYE